jgi:hypothetical protein
MSRARLGEILGIEAKFENFENIFTWNKVELGCYVVGEQNIDNGGFHHANPCLIGCLFGKNGKNLKSINKFRLW